MRILAAHQKEHLDCFIKIYGQFNNINKLLSNYIGLEQAKSPGKKIRAYEEIIQLRSSCKEDIKTYLKKRADKDYLKDEKQKAHKTNKIVGLLLI